mmetsp:Transcript_1464/g.2566  ORF Transcript_1464/g.2566 Transcript_1464/m.2566 type:complete len:109 (+) Transcript_1464:91-417(+)
MSSSLSSLPFSVVILAHILNGVLEVALLVAVLLNGPEVKALDLVLYENLRALRVLITHVGRLGQNAILSGRTRIPYLIIVQPPFLVHDRRPSVLLNLLRAVDSFDAGE